jgi:protein involved in polysaccharide export with SLBB domain
MRPLLVTLALIGCCAERTEVGLPAARFQAEPYVLVVGQVQRPGLYQLVAPTTLTQIIAAAGLTALSYREIITRTDASGRKVRARMSLAAIEQGTQSDVWLFPGDVVYVDERTF